MTDRAPLPRGEESKHVAAGQSCYSDSRAVLRAFVSSLFSLLLVTTLFWGGCISCEQYFMWPSAKSCCSPDGHCKTKKAPAKQDPGRECKQMAFDHQKSIDHHIDLPVIAAIAVDVPIHIVEAFAHGHGIDAIEPSPPDLQVLHSTFLI
jgi:hypothetical protein